MANILINNGSRLEKKKRTRLPLPVWLAFVLVVTLAVGGTLASYNSSSFGDTNARVAQFKMTTATGYTDNTKTVQLNAGSGDSDTYEFTITNDSEVKVRYSVIVQNVPANVEVTAKRGADIETRTSDGSDMTFTGKVLDMNDPADDWTLTFKALDDAADGMQDVTVQVHTEQMD